MIRYGDTGSIPKLKTLWKACFSDEDAYIDAFFEAMYEQENVLLIEEGGVLMGASFFLPGALCLKAEKRVKQESWTGIRYVYALAVYAQYRGKGLAGSLLREAYQRYQVPLVAEPAEEGLVTGFYGPAGFSASFYLEKEYRQLPQSGLQAAQLPPVYPADAKAYCRIRNAYFRGPGYVEWPLRHVDFALREHRANGGDALVYTGGGKEGILLYYMEGSKAVVTESTLPVQEIAAILGSWLSVPCDGIEVTSASCGAPGAVNGRDSSKNRRLVGMVYGLQPISGYLNLSLD